MLKELGKTLSDELGLTDAFDCVTKGDLGACGDTALNILGSLLGGVAARMLARYGLPWKWKEAADLARKIGGLIAEGIGHIKNWLNSFEMVKKARAKVASLKKIGCSSFVPGTQVLMADGTHKPIEEIKIGDQLIATDPVTGESEAQPVLALMVGEGEKNLVRINVDTDGPSGDKVGIIIATDHHPFWVAGQAHWFNADQIRSGMWLQAAVGTLIEVTTVSKWTAIDQRVYNLAVANSHTYHVAVGGADVLVHNTSACIRMASAIGNDPYLVRAAREAGKSHQKSLDHLFEQLANGNMNPGIGNGSLAGTDVMYARARDGARLFFRKVGDKIVIVGKANKGNEQKVINRLNDLYG
ncbi:hypothetical protein GCM10010160_57490 [Acrocarpospora corrugata]|uniref:polymorphic toxin-type HINT domain-containing protein n=1 Tax=Acrocarpospora corrugata TaxID=35763 RepID=UPI0012D2E905